MHVAKPYLFLSYSRADARYVDRLVEFLRAHGIEVWIDRDTLHPARWAQEIRNRIDRCAAVVVVETSASRRSQWVAKEVGRALTSGIAVCALVLDGQVTTFDGVFLQAVVSRKADPPQHFVDEIRSVMKLDLAADSRSCDTRDFYAGMDLRGVNLSEDDLSGAKLTGTDFRFANLQRARCDAANLTKATLIGANLAQADLRNADLTRAQLIGCDLKDVNFDGATLHETNFCYAKLGQLKPTAQFYRLEVRPGADLRAFKKRLRRSTSPLKRIWWRLLWLTACLTKRSS